MSASLTLATPEHSAQVLALVAAFHAEAGSTQSDDARAQAVLPLLDGNPLGAIYLIGPLRAPVGYVALSFGWSIEFGGMDCILDELFVRPPVRGRGIAGEVLISLPKALAGAGVRAMHLEVRPDNETAQRLYARAGFAPRNDYHLMTRRL